MEFSLIIPLWNEGKNVEPLIEMLVESRMFERGMKEVLLIDNGSTDETAKVVEKHTKNISWITVYNLDENLNYGGGVYYGITKSETDLVAYIPGDLQVSTKDLEKVWLAYKKQCKYYGDKIFVKGHRITREDPLQTQFVSHVYTFLANVILGLKIKDVNGLPKLFNKEILNHLPSPRAINFVFDTQLLLASRKLSWHIEEVEVTFHGRREGVSSWSGKRFKVYWETIKQIVSMRGFK
jgi:glycosyltransferase involved in cell wall biosynthesis